MPIIPLEGEIREKNILDGREFDKIITKEIGVINGGLDRENLPEGTFSADSFKDYAFHQWWQTYVKLPESRVSEWDDVVPNTTIDGLIYDNYVGGYEINSEYFITAQTIEGALHVEFNCWYWFDKDIMDGSTAGDWVQAALYLNGNIIAESHLYYQKTGNISLVAMVPVATGYNEIKVGFKLPSRNSSTTLNEQFFYYSGGNLLAVNRYR